MTYQRCDGKRANRDIDCTRIHSSHDEEEIHEEALPSVELPCLNGDDEGDGTTAGKVPKSNAWSS